MSRLEAKYGNFDPSGKIAELDICSNLPEFGQLYLGRRDFLRVSFFAALGLVGACTSPATPARPTRASATSTAMPEATVSEPLPELTLSELQEVVGTAVDDYNKILGTNLDRDQASAAVVLVKTETEFQTIVKKLQPSYVATSEKFRPAITGDNKVYINKSSIVYFTNEFPNTAEGSGARKELLEFVLAHELAHWSAVAYTSPDLYNLVFGKMFKNTAELKNKTVEMDIVQGAEIKAKVDGEVMSSFQNVEEAEATMLGTYVMNKRQGKRFIKDYPGSTYPARMELLTDLVIKINPNDINSTLQKLAQLRSKMGGREEWAKLIGGTFNIPDSDQLFFALSLLFAIDQGDSQLYKDILSRARSWKSNGFKINRLPRKLVMSGIDINFHPQLFFRRSQSG